MSRRRCRRCWTPSPAWPGEPLAQVRILEVASLPQIRQALERDAFHVLHLSAHGSAQSVELEDEDGNPVPVTAEALMGALQQAGRPVPLIVLSSCSGGSAATQAMAAGLIGRGADRVIAMLAPVTDGYATTLARHLYQELAARPELTAGQALATGPVPGRGGPLPRCRGPAAAAGVRGGHAAGRRGGRAADRSGGSRRCR